MASLRQLGEPGANDTHFILPPVSGDVQSEAGPSSLGDHGIYLSGWNLTPVPFYRNRVPPVIAVDVFPLATQWALDALSYSHMANDLHMSLLRLHLI